MGATDIVELFVEFLMLYSGALLGLFANAVDGYFGKVC